VMWVLFLLYLSGPKSNYENQVHKRIFIFARGYAEGV